MTSLNQISSVIVDDLKSLLGKLDYAVLEWENVPKNIRECFPNNGGDESWFVICRQRPECIPFWIEAMDSCHEPDQYIVERFNSGDFLVFVGCHA